NGHRIGADALTITYGALREALPALRRRLADPGEAAAWQAALELDVATHLPQLLLAAALRQNPGGIVLFSAASERRVADNARIARERPYPPEIVDRLVALARGVTDLGSAGRSPSGSASRRSCGWRS